LTLSGVLGHGHVCGENAALLGAFGKSLRHSRSGTSGETIAIAVRVGHGVVRVEVTDLAGSGVPEPQQAGEDAESGRGLALVASLVPGGAGGGAADGQTDGDLVRT